jgi:hypothetical protein
MNNYFPKTYIDDLFVYMFMPWALRYRRYDWQFAYSPYEYIRRFISNCVNKGVILLLFFHGSHSASNFP